MATILPIAASESRLSFSAWMTYRMYPILGRRELSYRGDEISTEIMVHLHSQIIFLMTYNNHLKLAACLSIDNLFFPISAWKTKRDWHRQMSLKMIRFSLYLMSHTHHIRSRSSHKHSIKLNEIDLFKQNKQSVSVQKKRKRTRKEE